MKTELFRIVENFDINGPFGTGITADGVIFPDGTTALRTRGPNPETFTYQNIGDVARHHCATSPTPTQIVYGPSITTHSANAGEWESTT